MPRCGNFAPCSKITRAWTKPSTNPGASKPSGDKSASALLLQGQQQAAEAEYKKWKDQPFNDEDMPTYRDAFLDVLEALEAAGVEGIDYGLVRGWLE